MRDKVSVMTTIVAGGEDAEGHCIGVCQGLHTPQDTRPNLAAVLVILNLIALANLYAMEGVIMEVSVLHLTDAGAQQDGLEPTATQISTNVQALLLITVNKSVSTTVAPTLALATLATG